MPLARGPAVGDQVPRAVGNTGAMTQDVSVAIIGPDFEPGVVRTAPLVDYFLHPILMPINAKKDGAFVGFSAGITFDQQFHNGHCKPRRARDMGDV